MWGAVKRPSTLLGGAAFVVLLLLIMLVKGGAEPTSATSGQGQATGSETGTTAHGSLVTGCQLAGSVLEARGDDGSVVGATKLEGTYSDAVCTFEWSFPVKPSSTYRFHIDGRTLMGNATYVASDLSRPILLLMS